MIKNETNQRWQEFEDRIENVFGRLLRGDKQRIAYEPQAEIPLLEMSSEYRDQIFLGIK